MYLTEDAVMELLTQVAHLPVGTSVTFDYRVLRALFTPVERIIGEAAAQRAAAVGESWISAFDPRVLRGQLLELGFSKADAWDPEALNRRYLYRRKDGLQTDERLILAEV